jgi:hypothetical protein
MGKRTIHDTELPRSRPNKPIDLEWETYRREVGRLLAEGHEGKLVFIKGNDIIGVYDTKDEAMDEGRRRYLLDRRLVQQIRTWEPVIRLRSDLVG